MNKSYLLYFTILLCSSIALQVLSVLDHCHSDPRLSTNQLTCTPTEHLLHIQYLNHNPNHGLHEWLWAVTYYLRKCREPDLSVVLNEHKYNTSLCFERDIVTIAAMNSSKIEERPPYWSICVAFIIIRSLQIPLFLHKSVVLGFPNGTETFLPNTTCAHRTYMGVMPTHARGIMKPHFRPMSWYMRECGDDNTCTGSGLIPISDVETRQTFRYIRSVVRSFFNVKPRDGSGGVRVLVYDRSDTHRRQWINAHDVVNRLRHDKRLTVRMRKGVQKSLREQVEDYTWADVVIASHGAAMANTAFMEDGCEVFEIWYVCESDTGNERFLPHAWTGWHAGLLGLNLRYIQCHYVFEGKEPTGYKMGARSSGKQRVNANEVLQLLEPTIHRQEARLRRIREGGIWIDEFERNMNQEVEVVPERASKRVLVENMRGITHAGIILLGPLPFLAAAMVMGLHFARRKSKLRA